MTVRDKNLDFIFNPGSIAIVGASPVPGKISNIIIESLKSSGYPGVIYPVNPKHANIGGLVCYPSLADINGGVDLAVIALPAPSVPGALRQGAGRVKGAVIVSGGFGETGEQGRALEREVREISRQEGIRVIGPNCMGLYDTVSKVDTFFVPARRAARPPAGGLSIISQSGSFAVTAMDELAAEGIGVARVVSYGNMADVNESDCLDFLAGDEATKAVAVYIESVEDGRRFVEAASRCAARKPVMAVKVGKAGAGAAAARSHTGAMTGRYEVYRAAFRKAGVIELDGYEDFIVGCKAFGALSGAAGKRVMIITDGGGMGVGIADACVSAGLDVAPLGADAAEDLKAVFPSYFSISNPLDLTGSATDDMFADAIDKTMQGEGYDMAIVAPLWGPPALTDELAELICERAAYLKKPLIVCTPGGAYTRGRMELFRRRGLPVFSTPESAVRAASVLARAGDLSGKSGGHG
ncbi:MAG: CoA-binding protein [Deltaproteobacteria bacterium]|nr:CoA-binding protein [Deltaproteobacteria bacterium]